MTVAARQTSDREEFAPILGEAIRVLTLGRALSPAQPATLSRRGESGFLLGALIGGPREDAPFVAQADAEGRIGNEFPADLPRDAGALHAAVLAARPEAGAVVLIRARGSPPGAFPAGRCRCAISRCSAIPAPSRSRSRRHRPRVSATRSPRLPIRPPCCFRTAAR